MCLLVFFYLHRSKYRGLGNKVLSYLDILIQLQSINVPYKRLPAMFKFPLTSCISKVVKQS